MLSQATEVIKGVGVGVKGQAEWLSILVDYSFTHAPAKLAIPTVS